MRFRDIVEDVTGRPTIDGAGVRLVRVLGSPTVKSFDPFLMLDAFDSANPEDYIKGFPMHPHRGIETFTYLVEGVIEHKDSLGNAGAIRDGGCQWMTAGSGILHQEMPQPSPRMLGLQLWINLPAAHKMTAPKYRDITASMVPRVEEEGAVVAVVAGDYGGTPGAASGDYVRVRFLDVRLKPGARWQTPTDPAHTVFAYVYAGNCHLAETGAPVLARHAYLLGEGDVAAFKGGAEECRFVLVSGAPLREPVAWGGPIVMNTEDELMTAYFEIEEGTFIRHGTPARRD